MPSNNYACVNGRFLSEAQASVSIFDRGFLYGHGVFETMRVYGGRMFRAPEHMQRLFGGLNALNIESVDPTFIPTSVYAESIFACSHGTCNVAPVREPRGRERIGRPRTS